MSAFEDKHATTSEQDNEEEESLSQESRKVLGKLERALQNEGISKFSTKFIIEYVANKLRNNEGDKLQHVIAYLLSLVNDKQSDGRSIIPGLRSKPIWTKEDLPWITEVEGNFEAIRKEFLLLRDRLIEETCNCANHSSPPEEDNEGDNEEKKVGFQRYRNPSAIIDAIGENNTNAPTGGEITDRGQWNVCYLMLHGQDFTHNQEACPVTMNVINNILPRQYSHALFSALAPDTHITEHCGPTNKKIRCFLPLFIPNTDDNTSTSWLKVNHETHYLNEGQAVVFDDSFLHEAANDHMYESRVVLIADFWHPDLTDEEIKLLTFIQKHQMLQMKKMQKKIKEENGESSNNDPENLMYSVQQDEEELLKNVWGNWHSKVNN